MKHAHNVRSILDFSSIYNCLKCEYAGADTRVSTALFADFSNSLLLLLLLLLRLFFILFHLILHSLYSIPIYLLLFYSGAHKKHMYNQITKNKKKKKQKEIPIQIIVISVYLYANNKN